VELVGRALKPRSTLPKVIYFCLLAFQLKYVGFDSYLSCILFVFCANWHAINIVGGDEGQSQGGLTRKDQLGHEGYQELGSKGGQTRKDQLGHEGYQELGSKGGQTRKEQIGLRLMSPNIRLGTADDY
jgi:hypothetical protein